MQSAKVFRAALDKWAAKVGDQADGLARQICFEMGSRVEKATPFDLGNLRAMWQPSIGGAIPSPSPDGPDVSLVCQGIKAGDIFTMSNGAAYAYRLEYGFVGADSLGRVYNQPGRFYVRDTVAQFPAIVDAVAADLGLRQ